MSGELRCLSLGLVCRHNNHAIIKPHAVGDSSALSNCCGAFAIALIIRICAINAFDCTEVIKTRVVQHSDRMDVDFLKKYLLWVNNSGLLIVDKSTYTGYSQVDSVILPILHACHL